MKTPAMQNQHFYQLDSLRGIFILGIVIYHVNASFGAAFSEFMARRLRRLYPLYILTTVVQLCLRILLNKTTGITVKAILLNVLMIQSGWIDDGLPFNTPLWFVSVLMLCYIIFFALCRLSGKDGRRYMAMVILLMLWGLVLEIGNFDIPFCYN